MCIVMSNKLKCHVLHQKYPVSLHFVCLTLFHCVSFHHLHRSGSSRYQPCPVPWALIKDCVGLSASLRDGSSFKEKKTIS